MKAFDARNDPFQSGDAVVAVSGSASGTVPVVFDPPYANPPHVFVQVIGNANYIDTSTVPSATGFTPGVSHKSNTVATTNVAIHWIAYGF